MRECDVKPEWAPENSGDEFASFVMPGVRADKITSENKPKIIKRPNVMAPEEYISGVRSGDLNMISKAITLVESNSPKHEAVAQEVLKGLLPFAGNSIRIGITGPPGAGKSTFIEALGMYLCKNGVKVAVLAIDPSSTKTRGSILGDKTRMEMLSREKNAYIRPSPSSGNLGGVARKTRETMIVCEASGYEVILIETIGVGQSEVTVRSMVDFFLLMLLPGSGDELQGIKKGVVELADVLLVNKADANNIVRANLTKQAYSNALTILQPATEGWKTKVLTCSAIEETGIDNVWSCINEFMFATKNSGVFEARRHEQMLDWVYSMIEESLKSRFYSNPKVMEMMPAIEKGVIEGTVTPAAAVMELINLF